MALQKVVRDQHGSRESGGSGSKEEGEEEGEVYGACY